jgi:hypothetical protein
MIVGFAHLTLSTNPVEAASGRLQELGLALKSSYRTLWQALQPSGR